MPKNAAPLLHFEEALSIVLGYARALPAPLSSREVRLDEVPGRVLAADLLADRDQPPFARSTRDGYAIRSIDSTRERKVIGAIRAGERWTGAPLRENQAIEIMTGAPVPASADAVVMVEHTTFDQDPQGTGEVHLRREQTWQPGENVVPQGAEARAGEAVRRAGTRFGAAEIALAASVGAAAVPIFAQPRVAIIATGDELVPLDATPGPMQIRNSNSHGLAALVRSHGGIADVLSPAADTHASVAERITNARGAAMLLLSGGVSAGKYDFVEEVLLSLGAEFFFTGVKMQPGKPVVFGRLPPSEHHAEQWVFGLPGNPVSTQVTATLFAMPLLRALGGERDAAPLFVQATLGEEMKVRPGPTKFLPARLDGSVRGTTVRPTGWQGSGDLHSNARANCYVVVPPERDSVAVGEIVTVLLR